MITKHYYYHIYSFVHTYTLDKATPASRHDVKKTLLRHFELYVKYLLIETQRAM